MMKIKIYFPLLLLLFLFLAEKIILIPAIKNFGRRKITSAEITSLYAEHILKEIKDRNSILFLGTSRSQMFEYLSPQLLVDNIYINSGEKKRIKKYYLETRLVLPGTDIITQIVLLQNILNFKHRPKTIVLELSPYLFNDHFNQKRWAANHYSYSFLWGSLPHLSLPMAEDALLRLLFVGYNYKFSPGRFVKRLQAGESYSAGAAKILHALKQKKSISALRADYLDFHGKELPPELYSERFIGYAHIFKNELSMQRFSTHDSYGRILKKTLRLFKKSKIKVILWLPPVHHVFDKIVYQAYDFNDSFWPAYYKIIQSTALPFYDGRKEKLQCNYWSDSGHIAIRCAPLILNKLIILIEDVAQSK